MGSQSYLVMLVGINRMRIRKIGYHANNRKEPTRLFSIDEQQIIHSKTVNRSLGYSLKRGCVAEMESG